MSIHGMFEWLSFLHRTFPKRVFQNLNYIAQSNLPLIVTIYNHRQQ